MSALYDTLTNKFDDFFHSFEKKESPQLLNERKTAFDIFSKNNFPTTKNEEWRFTDVSRFLNDDFKIRLKNKVDISTIQKAIKKVAIKKLDAYNLVLVNGEIYHEFSSLPQTNMLEIKFVNEIKNTVNFETLIHQNADMERSPLAALNTAFFEKGYFIEVKKNVRLDKPLQIIQIFSDEENVFFQPRNFFKVLSGADCSLIETSICCGKKIFFMNSYTEILVDENAQLHHFNFQQGGANERWICHSQVRQAKNSRYENFTLTFPRAALTRNNLSIILNGSNAETYLNGLYVAGSACLTDTHSLIQHRFPSCKSAQLYKGIVLDGGRGVFNGKIYVRREAQKTNAFQQNNNLLFSPNAVVNSKPQLEIFADDVKCSHGTTIGQFDEEPLFYLRSRGVGEDAARELLVNAFAADITEKIKNENLRKHIERLVENSIS